MNQLRSLSQRRWCGPLWCRVLWTTALIMTTCSTVSAAAPAPPARVTVHDRPNDAGTGLIVRWEASPDDKPDAQPLKVSEYRIYRETVGEESAASSATPVESTAPQGEDTSSPEDTALSAVPAGNFSYVDGSCEPSKTYLYRVVAVGPEGAVSEPRFAEEPLQPVIQWFDRSRTWGLVTLVVICGAVIICTELAKRGMSTYIRPIAGLSAIDEAVGRATEMGRPMLFVPGIMDLDQIETIAGLTVMAYVGEKAAEYDTPMDVPTTRTLVMTAAKEALAGAYLTAGRPESFNEDRVYYVTEDQFGYVASVCGWMSREKPAACFYLGKFYAESLVLAETGNAVGAIQLAGTAEPAQLPFFVAACDYTLIGEELFAASAYLSGEPQQLGTLKGQDIGKLIAGILLVVGCLTATLAQFVPDDSPINAVHRYLVDVVLTRGES